MEAFRTHTGIGVPLRRSNVDTDQIIPAVYLKRVTRTGFEDGLFAAWRNDPSFVLNLSPFDKGSVLVAGPDFGTGSSREHAVWALMDYGFRVVISSRFADIFRGNAGKAGLLAAEVAQDDVELLWKLIEQHPGLEITVNLQDRNVAAGTVMVPFKIDDYTAWRLLEGLDDIGLTLRKLDEIESYEASRPQLETAHSAGRDEAARRAEIAALRTRFSGPSAGGQGRQADCRKVRQLRLKLRVALGNQWSMGLPCPLVGPKRTTGFGGFA